jgi:hypothetical protein
MLILDGHVTLRVITDAGSQGLPLIQLVPHSLHIAQPLDLCVFSLFKTIYYKKNKSKSMKGEIWKMYRALIAFYKATIISIVH